MIGAQRALRSGPDPVRVILHPTHRGHRIRLAGLERCYGLVDVLSAAKRRRRLKQHYGIDERMIALILSQRIDERSADRTVVARQLFRAQTLWIRPARASAARNGLAVRGDHDRSEPPGGARRFYGVCQQGLSTQRLQILAGEALRAAARGNDAEVTPRHLSSHARRSNSAVLRQSPSSLPPMAGARRAGNAAVPAATDDAASRASASPLHGEVARSARRAPRTGRLPP